MKVRNLFLSILCTLIIYLPAYTQGHPHILVNDNDKPLILNKIQQQPWAKTDFERIKEEVTKYVEIHKTNPEWILSRYLMNRVPGKRYTLAYSDEDGTELIKWAGDAPVPTVRVSSHKRGPVTASGASYRRPSLEELVPYDTARLICMVNQETNKKEWIDPKSTIGGINGEINDLALDAAIVYWLKGDENYAKFAADILDQWAQGAYYQQPIIGACRTGFLDVQTLGDRNHLPLILAFDFVYPYMKRKGYDLHYYENVFEKFASTLAFRGLWNNNWFGAESATMVFASLSLENSKKRDYYLQFYLEKDTINGNCGQLALPSAVTKWLTPDGHWREPGGYHNFPVSNLLIAALALEKNGYDVFQRFPALFKASYAMLKYSFPNLTESAYGDSGRASQSPESLEIGILGAIKYKQPELPEMLATMKKLVEGGKYRRENSGYLGLLSFIPELPGVESVYNWPRSGYLDFARFFLQRNGTDPQTGLSYVVQGASYNHNHCNGMAIELYGVGEVMGIDAGTGPNYDHPLHVNYFSQWAAHNTVVAAGSSSSVPVAGNAGRKEIGQVELASMEPMPDKEAVSPFYSFTDTRYYDNSTKTNEMRTLAIVRTSDRSGYYVDIYRSDNQISNDYIYHNIGEQLTFLNNNREPIVTKTTEYPLTGKDYPGFRYYTEVEKLENWSGSLIALFTAKDDQSKDIYMQLLIPGKNGRVYYKAKSPKTHTSGRQYAGKALPVFTMRDNGESINKPFIAVFEPYKEKNGFSVDKISLDQRNDGKDFISMTVYNRDLSKQIIFQSVDPGKTYSAGNATFCGYFGIVEMKGDRFSSIYLGEGKEISYKGYSLKPQNLKGSASLTLNGKNYQISCNQNTVINLPVKNINGISIQSGTSSSKLYVTKTLTGILVTVPPVKDGLLMLD